MPRWEISNEISKILEACVIPIYITDNLGKLIFRNEAHIKMSRRAGITYEEEDGAHVKDLVANHIMSKSVTMKVLETKRVETIEQRLKNMVVITTGVPVFDEDGEIFQVVSTFQDSTELNRLRNEIEQMSDNYMYIEDTSLMVARSPQLRKIIQISKQISRYDSTCLILGESGVG